MEVAGKWYIETIFPDLAMMLRVREMIFSGRTPYQQVEVMESDLFGRSLALDYKTQSTERDEFIYHETLVHPSILQHPNPKTVFIGGGGEGATLRETLAHKSVEKVVMVDLDAQVVEFCRQHLPNHHQGSFDDPRLELRHEDARGYLANCDQKFDVMIMDLVDPLEGGPAYLLYTEEYYRLAKAKLNPGGVLTTQSGPAGLITHQECFTAIYHTLAQVFRHTFPTEVHVPAFQTMWGFTIASDSPFPAQSPEDIDRLLAQRLNKELRFYNGECHLHITCLPKFLRESIAKETRVNRDAHPVFMY